jgi:MFS family permease
MSTMESQGTARSALPYQPPPLNRKVVIATVIGNWLEFFDFTVYSIFAVYIGKAFFPTFSSTGQILMAVAAFGIGFIFRPLGGIVIGAYGDRAGRRAAVTLTIMLMAGGTALFGVTPGYATVGPLAPVLIILARVIQGLSTGGTIGAATSYLVEAAPDGRRGLYGSWQYASQGIGAVCAGLMGYGLTTWLTAEQMAVWGWRVPFFFGLLIAPVGLYIRRNMNETAAPEAKKNSTAGMMGILFREHGALMVFCLLAVMGMTISNYIIKNYMTTYAIHTLKMSEDIGMLASLVAGAAAAVGAVVAGALSDRYGRALLMIVPRALFVLAAYPCFAVITHLVSPLALLSMIAVLSTLQAMSGAVIILVLPECFPRTVRSSGTAITYSLGVTIFGGTAQLAVTWLLDLTGNPLAIAWYLIVTNFIGMVALFFLHPPKAKEHLS